MSTRRKLGPALAVTFAATLASASITNPALAQRKPPDTAPKEPTTQEISLGVGENKTVNVGDVKEFSEGRKGIVEIRPTADGQKFVLVGQKAGQTTILLIKNDGTQTNLAINVFSRQPDQVEAELNELLQSYPGVKTRKVGQRLFVEGGVSNEGDAKRIAQIAALYSGQVESLVTVGNGAADRKLNVRIDFFFVQYTKNSGYLFGIDWPNKIGGPSVLNNIEYDLQAGALNTATASIVNQPLPSLDIAAANGWAKVAKQATVITTNGTEATFENGGELNFAVNSGFSAQIQRIPFGTNVTVLPRFDPATRNLEVKVAADVADLTPPAGSSLPGRQTSKLSTLVFLKLGQSLVLSGIRTRTQRHSIQGLPLLSQIPVLGVLFGTHSDQKEDTEGAVFIIPSVVDSVPKGTYDIVKEAMKQYDNYSGDLDEVNSFQKEPPSDEAPAK